MLRIQIFVFENIVKYFWRFLFFFCFDFKMSKTKKLSLEDKRIKMMELFHDKKDVFLLKDLEKIAPKLKGITFQTVKEVLMSLVGDDMVDTDKIGTSTYFWAFPSKTYNNMVQKLSNCEKNLDELQQKDENLDAKIEQLIKSSTENEEEAERRAEIQDKLIEMEKERVRLKKELDRFAGIDPDNFDSMKDECKVAREAVDRWTDNVFAVKSWCKNKFYLDDSEVNKNLGIPSSFDYYEG